MDVYHISVDLKPGVRDHQFVEALNGYLGALKADGAIESWRLLRRKLGLGPSAWGEFQILIETQDMAQLDRAFTSVSSRTRPIEDDHFSVNSLVANFQAGLWRDFPDAHRRHGAERF